MIGESLRLPPGAGPDDCYDAGTTGFAICVRRCATTRR